MAARPGRGLPQQRGYTLTELVIVVVTLALVAAIAAQSFDSEPDRELALVASEFASAIRFARSESIRTGAPHGFRFLSGEDRIRVFRADTSGSPWTWVWDTYHPVTRQLYDYSFPVDLAGAPDPASETAVYRGTCSLTGAVYFDANGTPWCLEPETTLLESYRLDLASSDEQVAVLLDGITGRVTVQ